MNTVIIGRGQVNAYEFAVVKGCGIVVIAAYKGSEAVVLPLGSHDSSVGYVSEFGNRSVNRHTQSAFFRTYRSGSVLKITGEEFIKGFVFFRFFLQGFTHVYFVFFDELSDGPGGKTSKFVACQNAGKSGKQIFRCQAVNKSLNCFVHIYCFLVFLPGELKLDGAFCCIDSIIR